jgi:hypothetical protein
MSNVKTLIEQLGQQAKTNVDLALHRLLVINAEKLPEVNDYFHIKFLKDSVTNDQNIDIEIWELINVSHAFWDVFYDMTDVIIDGELAA